MWVALWVIAAIVSTSVNSMPMRLVGYPKHERTDSHDTDIANSLLCVHLVTSLRHLIMATLSPQSSSNLGYSTILKFSILYYKSQIFRKISGALQHLEVT